MNNFLSFTIFYLMAFNSYAVDIVKIKLLEVTVPSHMDDHCKFGLATPDFELVFRVKCNGGETIDRAEFVLPANKSNIPVTHKIKNVEIAMTRQDIEYCHKFGGYIFIEEDELIGTDLYLYTNLNDIFFSQNLKLKTNSNLVYVMEEGSGEADKTFFGLGRYKPFSAKVDFKSVVKDEG